jgi:hypothetical protein
MSEPTEPYGCSIPDVLGLTADLRTRATEVADFAIWSLDEETQLLDLRPFAPVPGLRPALRELASKPKIRRMTPDGVDFVLIVFRSWLLRPRTAETMVRSIIKGVAKGLTVEQAAAARFQAEIRRMISRNTLSALAPVRLDEVIEFGLEPGVEDGELVEALHAA